MDRVGEAGSDPVRRAGRWAGVLTLAATVPQRKADEAEKQKRDEEQKLIEVLILLYSLDAGC